MSEKEQLKAKALTCDQVEKMEGAGIDPFDEGFQPGKAFKWIMKEIIGKNIPGDSPYPAKLKLASDIFQMTYNPTPDEEKN